MLYRDVFNSARPDADTVEPARLLDRICVRAPYFALRQLRYDASVLQATASYPGVRGREYGPMPGAEISRHAAIAGLSVAALAQPDSSRRYYLAQEATYQGRFNRVPFGHDVQFTAELLGLDKRQARSRIVAHALGETVAEVEVLYTILTDMAFSRLFRHRQQPEFLGAGLQDLAALPSGTTRREGDRLIREIASIPAAACAGHFDGYPAMPVAILMGQLAQLAGEAFGGPFHIPSASVQASDFCWAGEAARFEVAPRQVTALRTTYACSAHADDRLVGQMTLTLEHRV